MVVVTLTSWTDRIGHVKRVLESILGSTVIPDRIYLNLSSTEFDGIPLPEDLVDYMNVNERIILNWVSGENTRSMKKMFPILGFLDDDDIIIDADDDFLFPKDLIESRISDFNLCGRKYSITSNRHISCGFGGKMRIVSPTSLFQKKMLKNYDNFLTDTIIRTYNDDRTYLTLLWLNGYHNIVCSRYDNDELQSKYGLGLEDTSMCSKHMYLIGKRYDKVVNEDFRKRTGVDIINSFGYYGR